MKRRATALLTFFLAILFSAYQVGDSAAQTQPLYPLIFDDFDYRSVEELISPGAWMNQEGQVIGEQKAWYKGNWDDAEFASTAHLEFENPGRVRLETEAGHFYFWQKGLLPPMLISGFVHRTGTWAARLRFDDISFGSVTESPLSMAFWTMSPTAACVDDPRQNECSSQARKWSEFNHEWNNAFNRTYKQFLANGGVVDGEVGHTSAFYMQSPAKTVYEDLSCRRIAEGVDERIDEPSTCMSWFVSNENPDRFVDLLIQYDGDMLVFEAMAWHRIQPSGSMQRVSMRKSIRLGRLTQPMTTRFSLLGRTRDSCDGLQISESSCWKQDTNLGFSVDWFFYTPTTEVDLLDVGSNVGWLRSKNLSRVNTTGTRTDAPPPRHDLTATLDDPSTNRAKEWVVVPSQRSTIHERIQISWSHRTRVSHSEPWSAWSAPARGGYTYNPGVDQEAVHQVNVRATVSDWYDERNSITVYGCRTGSTYSIGTCSWQSQEFLLGESYPNPTRSGTTIPYELPVRSLVTLSVFDALGRKIETLVHKYRNAGHHTVYWDSRSYPSGMYFYVLSTHGTRRTKSLVVVR